MKLFCHIPVAPLRQEATDRSEMVSQVLFGELMETLQHDEKWTQVRCLQDGYVGWIDNKQYLPLSDEEADQVAQWPIVVAHKWVSISITTPLLFFDGPDELVPMDIPMGSRLPKESRITLAGRTIEHSQTIFEEALAPSFDVAFKMLNAPYLWGGKTGMGIDCSGFTQTVYRVYGKSIPRDASQQALIGKPINDLNDTQRGDLLFFANEQGRITHVAIKFGPNTVIHASGKVRIDHIDTAGIYNKEEQRYTHKLHSIRRIFD